LSFEGVRKAGALRNVFQETLRLYPPVSFFVRAVTRPTVMRDKRIRPGAMMVVSPWLIQRNSGNFPCPHAFEPARFADPDQAEACRRAYLPFGKGPRKCTGSAFAQQEAMLVLGAIVRNFRLAYPPGPKPEPVSRVTLRARKGIHLRLTPREAGPAQSA
jgi:cytochrome P450